MFHQSKRSLSEEMHHSLSLGTTEPNNKSDDRPEIQVEPRGIGPVVDLHENDVLCGRGGRINGHYGNIQFRKFCSERREDYFKNGIKKVQKAHIAASVVRRIRSMSPPGRFLKQDGKTGQWFDIGCAKAMTKVGQAIREHTPKAEEGFMGGAMGQNQERGSTPLSFTGPLYPGYNATAVEHPGQVEPTPVGTPFSSSIYQSPVASSHAVNRDCIASSGNNDFGGSYTTPIQPMAFSAQKRSSMLSAMSGVSRMSALLRASVQSDLSDCLVSSVPARRQSRTDSLLRQSVLSDISDCMSTMSLEDAGYSNRSITANHCLGMQEDFDARLAMNNQPIGDNAMPRMEFPNNLEPKMISDPTDANLNKDPVTHGRWSSARHSRKNSLSWSISMASTISMLSLSSATSFAFP